MAAETPYLRAILPSLPSDFAKNVRTLCRSPSEPSPEHVLDTLIRFIIGAECAPNLTNDARIQWSEKQKAASKILRDMIHPPSTTSKREREDDPESGSKALKRPRLSVEQDSPSSPSNPAVRYEEPVFALHSVSTTSPIRKKVDITIHKTSLRLTHPTTHVIEASIPLSTLTRAFLLPTREKPKAHWTVVILSCDTPDRSKPSANSPQSTQQVIFGIDAVTASSWSTTTHTSPSTPPEILPKGSATRPSLMTFLSHLGVQVTEPKPEIFKSACAGITSGVSASDDGIPGIVAYQGAKRGSLWFMKEGILWGESKPCEFWAVEDLIGKSEGLRVIGANGRTCTVVLTRKGDDDGEEVGDDEEDVGVETQFGLVDAQERPGIEGWVRAHRHLFGKKSKVKEGIKARQIEDDSDTEDEDFKADSDIVSDGSSSSSSEDDRDGSDMSGADSEADRSDEEEELKEQNHPLLKPGAMPRMSRAVVDMVVGMMEEDMLDPVGTTVERQSDDESEEDELED